MLSSFLEIVEVVRRGERESKSSFYFFRKCAVSERRRFVALGINTPDPTLEATLFTPLFRCPL